jgi:hypothetical protein
MGERGGAVGGGIPGLPIIAIADGEGGIDGIEVDGDVDWIDGRGGRGC